MGLIVSFMKGLGFLVVLVVITIVGLACVALVLSGVFTLVGMIFGLMAKAFCATSGVC